MSRTTTSSFLVAISSVLALEPVGEVQGFESTFEAETKRAFEQERQADVVVFYDTDKEIHLERPKRKEVYGSEAALLAYFTERKEPKKLLVVILSKRHEYSDPKQTLDGFWKACKKTGFEQVVIQQAAAFGRPILHE